MDRSRSLDRDEVEKFVSSLGSMECAIPDELLRHYLSRAGFATDDPRLERLIALAAQKFIADVAHDAISHSRLRQIANAPPTKKKIERDPRIVLTVDDLERALHECGVMFRKPPYFADSLTAGAPEPAQVQKPASAPPGTQPPKQA